MNWREETKYNLISQDGKFRVAKIKLRDRHTYELFERKQGSWDMLNRFPNAEQAKEAASNIKYDKALNVPGARCEQTRDL